MSQVIDPALYPDIARHAGLAAAMVDAARRASVDLGPLTVPQGIDGYWTAAAEAERGWVSVSLAANQRVFLISVATTTHVWMSGETDELSDVVHVTDMWRKGAILRQLHARFPFMTYSRMAQAWEDGNPRQVRWESLLEDPSYTAIRPLLMAARANDRLLQLFPSITMFATVRFAVDPADSSSGEVLISLVPDGRYEVGATWSDSNRTVTSISEAIIAAAALLP